MVSREALITELKTAAKPLADSCAPEISQKVEAAVEEAVTAWEETCTNLRDLCTKYHHAADLWKQYKDASDLVREWVDEQMESVDNLEGEEAVKTVKVSRSIRSKQKVKYNPTQSALKLKTQMAFFIATSQNKHNLKADMRMHFNVRTIY